MAEDRIEIVARHRAITYWVVGLGLTLTYAVTRGSAWVGSVQLHTLMETVATLLAAIVGAMALVRFYTRKDTTFLLIGVGFLGTAFLDGFHAVVTSTAFRPYMPSELPSLIPWSWVASRQFLSILMFLSWLAWWREDRLGEKGRISEKAVYLFAAAFTVASFLFFAFAPLPRAYYPELFFHRPEEFVPALFFLLALVGYLRKGAWRDDPFEHWLVLALIVGLVGQAVFMSFSGQLFDFAFDAAHLLKKVSYVCVLTGLMISMYAIFRQADESEARIRAVVDTMVDGLITIDDKGVALSFNPAAERIFGYAPEEIVGRNVSTLMPEPDRGQHGGYLRDYLATGEAKIIGIGREVVGLRKDGTQFPMDLAVSQVRLGAQRLFVGSVRDISDRKRAEAEIRERTAQLEAANAELDAFNYTVSHDLRAPLRGMIGFGQALMEDHADKLDGQALDYLTRIRDAGRRMAQMIDDLLGLSRASRGELKYTQVDLSAMVEEIATELRERDRDRAVSFAIASDIDARGDARLLRIVLENLLGNAWKFTGNNDTATIEFGATREDGETVYFVRDDGAGFDMAYSNKLFGIFQRLHRTAEFEGTGIGLATVSRLIGRHGGRVWAEGAEAKGATFFFTLGS